jgi:oligopeptide/dipeptide ABC transporter ATP-binding protein
MPRLGRSRAGQPLPAIPGQVPTPASLPPGCRFSTRCMHADAQCRVAVPPLETVAADHAVRCLHWRRLSLADRSHA